MVFLPRCVVTLPAVLDVARFPADGKNRTALLAAQGCRAALLPVSPGQAAQDAQRRRQARNGIVTFIAAGVRSLGRQEIGLGQRCGVPLPETAWHACPQDLPSSVAVGAPPDCCRQIRT
jgi:hypothetical protein